MESFMQAFKLAVINVEVVFKQVNFNRKVEMPRNQWCFSPTHVMKGLFHALIAAAKVGEIPLRKMFVSHQLMIEKVGFQPRKAKLRCKEFMSKHSINLELMMIQEVIKLLVLFADEAVQALDGYSKVAVDAMLLEELFLNECFWKMEIFSKLRKHGKGFHADYTSDELLLELSQPVKLDDDNGKDRDVFCQGKKEEISFSQAKNFSRGVLQEEKEKELQCSGSLFVGKVKHRSLKLTTKNFILLVLLQQNEIVLVQSKVENTAIQSHEASGLLLCKPSLFIPDGWVRKAKRTPGFTEVTTAKLAPVMSHMGGRVTSSHLATPVDASCSFCATKLKEGKPRSINLADNKGKRDLFPGFMAGHEVTFVLHVIRSFFYQLSDNGEGPTDINPSLLSRQRNLYSLCSISTDFKGKENPHGRWDFLKKHSLFYGKDFKRDFGPFQLMVFCLPDNEDYPKGRVLPLLIPTALFGHSVLDLQGITQGPVDFTRATVYKEKEIGQRPAVLSLRSIETKGDNTPWTKEPTKVSCFHIPQKDEKAGKLCQIYWETFLHSLKF